MSNRMHELAGGTEAKTRLLHACPNFFPKSAWTTFRPLHFRIGADMTTKVDNKDFA